MVSEQRGRVAIFAVHLEDISGCDVPYFLFFPLSQL